MVSDSGFAEPGKSIRSTERAIQPRVYVYSHIRARLVAARINGYGRRALGPRGGYWRKKRKCDRESASGREIEKRGEREREREEAERGRFKCICICIYIGPASG